MSIILRKCKVCGKEAHDEEDLKLFRVGQKNKYNRRNICKKCYNASPRTKVMRDESNRKTNPKHFYFKDHNILPKNNPRTNICSNCLRRYPQELKKQTFIHHEEYINDDPLAHTIELCNSCHSRLHFYQGNFRRKGTKDTPSTAILGKMGMPFTATSGKVN